MLRLNLLSEEAKKEIKYKRLYSLIIRVDLMLLTGAIFLAIIFTGSQLVLKNNYDEFYNQEALIKFGSQDYDQKIREINEKLKTISQIQKEYVSTSALIKELTDRIPDGVFLNYIKADIAGQSLKIIGQAKRRENFLSLKTELSKSPVFTEIDSPLQNILQKENIDFEMNIRLDLNKLNQAPQ